MTPYTKKIVAAAMARWPAAKTAAPALWQNGPHHIHMALMSHHHAWANQA
jgi:hypothetical protein